MKKLYILLMAGFISACSDLTDVEYNIPDVTTGDVLDYSARQATIAYTGDLEQGYYYLELSTSSNFSEGSTITALFTGLQWQATGLFPGTTYYYRQCANDGLTTVNGPTKHFTTIPLVNISSINLRPWNKPTALEHLPSNTEPGLYYSEAATNTDYKGLCNFRPAYSNGMWLMPFDLEPTTEPYLFYAYAPYCTKATDKTHIPVSTRQQNIDYLCGKSGLVTASKCNADINMHHALARIIFHVTKSQDSNVEIKVNEYSIRRGLNSSFYFPIEGYLDLVRDTIDNQWLNEYLPRTLTPAAEITYTSTDMELYVIPFDFMDNQIDLQLSIGASYHDILRSSIPATSWKAGYQYEYTVTVRRNQLEIGDVTIIPWTQNSGEKIIIKN